MQKNRATEVLPVQRLRTAVEALERAPFTALFCVSVIYFTAAGVLSWKKQFWNDELFTFYISRRPTLADVWHVLLTGAEQLPPLFFAITRAFTRAFGDSRLSFRLPEILGFWVMCASLFYFVRRRSSTAHGLIAMLLPMLTGAFYYAYEARPYGLVLGFSGFALLCWQTAAEGRRRAPALAGLGLSLAAAVGCHYYALLSFIPFALGELVRTINRRRVDIPMWIALVGGLLPLALFLPLIRAAKGYSSSFWAKPHWTSAVSFYEDLLDPAVLALFAIPLIVAFHTFTAQGEPSPSVRKVDGPALHEIALALGFALIPIFGVILGKTITGVFTDRYAMTAVIGLSILLAWSIFAIGHQRAQTAVLVAAALIVFFALGNVNTYRNFVARLENRQSTYRFLSQNAAGLPLVIAGPHLFFELSHDAAQRHEMANFIYLADPTLAIRYTDTDDVERGLLALKQWAPLNVQDFHVFCASHKRFLVYGYSESYAWLIQELVNEKQPLIAMAQNGGRILFLISDADQ